MNAPPASTTMRSTTRPKLLLLDEVAGGLSEMECETLLALIRRIRATGVSVIWIERIVHALLATVRSSSAAACSAPRASCASSPKCCKRP